MDLQAHVTGSTLTTKAVNNTVVGYMQQPVPYNPLLGNNQLTDLYRQFSFPTPPWVNDDMLEDNEGKKIYEIITKEEQDDFPVQISTIKIAPEFKPRHSVVLKTIRELTGLKMFQGGNEEEWQNVKKLAEDWHHLAVKKGYLGAKLPIVRVDRKYVDTYYSLIAKAWTFRKHGIHYSPSGELAVDAYQVIKDAIRERSEKTPDLATIEYYILKSGGMLLGTHVLDRSPAVIIYYDSFGKSVMDRLLGNGQKPAKKAKKSQQFTPYPTIQPLVPVSPWGNGAGGGGSIGIGGGGNAGGAIWITKTTDNTKQLTPWKASGSAGFTTIAANTDVDANVTLRYKEDYEFSS